MKQTQANRQDQECRCNQRCLLLPTFSPILTCSDGPHRSAIHISNFPTISEKVQ